MFITAKKNTSTQPRFLRRLSTLQHWNEARTHRILNSVSVGLVFPRHGASPIFIGNPYANYQLAIIMVDSINGDTPKITWFSMGKSYQISGWWRYPHDLSETSIYRKHPYFMTKSRGRSSPGNLHGEPPRRPHTDRLRRPAPQVAPASARLMGSYLVGGCNLALWKIWVSWDDFPFPTDWKNTIHVPNHQPGINVVLLITKNGDIKRDIYTQFNSTVHVRYMIICADVRKISYH